MALTKLSFISTSYSERRQLPDEPNTVLSIPPAPQARLTGSDLSEATKGCVYHSDTAEMS